MSVPTLAALLFSSEVEVLAVERDLFSVALLVPCWPLPESETATNILERRRGEAQGGGDFREERWNAYFETETIVTLGCFQCDNTVVPRKPGDVPGVYVP